MSESHSSLKPVEQPLNLIPVGLKEAALDSPTFRATSLHFDDQVDVIERWLDGYIRAASKLVTDVSNLEATVNSFLTQSAPPLQISEAVLDHDYTLLAVRRYGEGAREYWNQTFRGVKKYESTVIEPVRTFLNSDLRQFKDTRRILDWSQKNFDAVIQRYSSQSKTKEASSSREDAFQLHEARKAYLKASMDYCTAAPQLRASLDQLVVRIFAEQFKEMRNGRDASAATFAKLGSEMERIRGWSREMENSERAFKKELQFARQQIETNVLDMTRPSRELGDYEPSNKQAYLGAAGGAAIAASAKTDGPEKGEKQGWLFLKTTVGKPTRTVWVRRWFYVKNGIFGWLAQGSRSGGVEESEKTGVLLCGVRTAEKEERRFTFEVKTNASSIILQAETQAELSEWMRAFDFAKRKALEDPASTDTSAQPMGIDPAFAISPPIAPEFAARAADNEQHGDDAPGGLTIPEQGGAGLGIAGARSSVDVTAARRVMSIDRPTESSNTSRIIQKLDLHKRGGGATPQLGPAPASAGGIAGLISASHNALPIGPGTTQSAAGDGPSIGGIGPRRNFTMTISTLAPNSLANPPAPTNLSHTAVVVSGERGISLGSKADGSGMPGGIMANLWGSSNWGHVNRLVDDAPKPSTHQRSASASPTPQRTIPISVDDVGVMDTTGEMTKDMPTLTPLTSDSGLGHRKTVSSVAATTETNLPGQLLRPSSSDREEYPNYYPLPLKAQHGQFRMLFPSVPRAEKVVLVFRATWNPNEQQEFPGRVYVTTKEVYFYSHYLGFVLVTGVSLSSISDVTAAPGRDCDFLYLHLKESSNLVDRKRITVRVFLDSLRLLQRRLNFLVQNANSDDPINLEEVIKTLIKMEFEKQERSSSVDSWDDFDYAAEDATAGDENSPPNQRGRNMKASLRIDGNLYGDSARTGREVQKFQLPRQAVVYAPQGMQASITREFNVSAKALFHVMFGDKSAVFQLLYCNRWGDNIVQEPWTKNPNDHWTRRFASEEHRTPMKDTQTIDILNDHLCYVVTNHRVPWRLPYSQRFHLVTKLVVTHVAKSKCKLAIFQQINWYKPPSVEYIKHLIENHALNALEADALDLTNVAMDQVAKLGNHSKTHKAIEIFGNIGQQTSVPQIDVATMSSLGSPQLVAAGATRQLQVVSLQKLVASDILVKMLRAISMGFDILVALGKGALELCTAHTLLVAVLLFSILYNSWYGYRDGMVWWHERSASKYMARLGVKPEPVIGKAIYLSDIEELITPPSAADNTLLPFVVAEQNAAGVKTCRTTFAEQLTTSMSQVGTGTHLHSSREALARYRHDLLVALRVVNRVERDIVLSEWERWLRTEERKCAQVEGLLVAVGKKDKGAKGPAKELDEELGAGFGEYCASCRDELRGFENRTALM